MKACLIKICIFESERCDKSFKVIHRNISHKHIHWKFTLRKPTNALNKPNYNN